jgi:hypothetical protein
MIVAVESILEKKENVAKFLRMTFPYRFTCYVRYAGIYAVHRTCAGIGSQPIAPVATGRTLLI